MTSESQDALLTMEEAIQQLSTTRGTFYRWLRAGKIAGFKLGRQWRFKQTEIDRFLRGDEVIVELPVSPRALIDALKQATGESHTLNPTEEDQEHTIAHVVDLMLMCGLKKGAMSLFIDLTENSADGQVGVLSMRIDGLIHRITDYDSRLHMHLVERLKHLSSMDVTEKRLPQDGRFRFKINQTRHVDFLVMTVPALLGESCSLKIVDPVAGRLDFPTLGLDGINRTRVESALTGKHGLFVASGPAGSGKTVTAYSLLNTFGTEKNRVVSVEQPPLLNLPGVVQTLTNESLGLGIDVLMRANRRQNWDVLYISQIRSAETLALALEDALSGTVVTTMNFSDAVSGLMTIRDWSTDGLQIYDVVALITAQRLVRRLCDKCKKPLAPSDEDLRFVDQASRISGEAQTDSAFYTAPGCEACHDGFKGRIGLFETLIPSVALRKALADEVGYEELRQIAIQQGMQPLFLEGIHRATEGITSIREVRRVSSDLVQHR